MVTAHIAMEKEKPNVMINIAQMVDALNVQVPDIKIVISVEVLVNMMPTRMVWKLALIAEAPVISNVFTVKEKAFIVHAMELAQRNVLAVTEPENIRSAMEQENSPVVRVMEAETAKPVQVKGK